MSQEKKEEKAVVKEQESKAPGAEKEEPKKLIPSILENKFADFTYKFVKYVPETVHPNVVTAIGIIAGILGGFCFFLGSFSRWFFLLAILGLITHIVCDNFDGYMARNRNQKSLRGGFFDLMSDTSVCTFTVLFIGLSSFSHMEVCAFGAPLYGLHMMVTLHYIMFYNEFPFPPFGPFEIHCTYIIVALLNFFLGEVELFWLGDFAVMLDDVILGIAALGAGIYLLCYAVGLFNRLKADGK
ncbi:MAG: CDP-alcohol phosphatidyltransferase family protein [Lachnospiraceae bacterium]|nr:CDP-alcohol phosphatidyltransferase family protein [Lachnospiraceae bacterium]